RRQGKRFVSVLGHVLCRPVASLRQSVPWNGQSWSLPDDLTVCEAFRSPAGDDFPMARSGSESMSRHPLAILALGLATVLPASVWPATAAAQGSDEFINGYAAAILV